MYVKILSVKNSISFQRALRGKEKQDYIETLKSAKEKVGQNGKSILIVHDASLPQNGAKNVGVGNFANQNSGKFLDFAKTYLGVNTIEVLPQGEPLMRPNGSVSLYSGSALSLGEAQIDLEQLTKEKFGAILTSDDLAQAISLNSAADSETLINYQNVYGENSGYNKALKKAFERFRALNDESELKKGFSAFKKENDDWLEPKAIFKVIAKEKGEDYKTWDKLDKTLYNAADKESAKKRIAQILSENDDEIEFYKFKQFLAEEHLKISRANINSHGMKLYGDMPIGFSKDEVWANPRAFMPNGEIGWGLPALNYNTIKDENSDAARLLKRKVQLNARRYDGIRVDAAWCYVKPKVNNSTRYDMKDSILNMIEKAVKETKGSLDKDTLIWEFEADMADFTPFDMRRRLIPPLKNRVKVYSQNYMNRNWTTNEAFIRRGWEPDEFLLGVGNHDPEPLKLMATSPKHRYSKNNATRALSEIFNINESYLEDPQTFAQYRFAEPMTSKNNMVFFMDVFGRDETFNSHRHDTITDFRYKIPEDFESAYIKGVKEGFGFSPMDSMEKIFKARGLNFDEKKLYKKIVHYKNVLLEDEGIGATIKKHKFSFITTGIVALGASVWHFINKNKKAKVQNETTKTQEKIATTQAPKEIKTENNKILTNLKTPEVFKNITK